MTFIHHLDESAIPSIFDSDEETEIVAERRSINHQTTTVSRTHFSFSAESMILHCCCTVLLCFVWINFYSLHFHYRYLKLAVFGFKQWCSDWFPKHLFRWYRDKCTLGFSATRDSYTVPISTKSSVLSNCRRTFNISKIIISKCKFFFKLFFLLQLKSFIDSINQVSKFHRCHLLNVFMLCYVLVNLFVNLSLKLFIAVYTTESKCVVCDPD